jgi:hypothetical protein
VSIVTIETKEEDRPARTDVLELSVTPHKTAVIVIVIDPRREILDVRGEIMIAVSNMTDMIAEEENVLVVKIEKEIIEVII